MAIPSTRYRRPNRTRGQCRWTRRWCRSGGRSRPSRQPRNWRRLELQEDGGDVLADEVGHPCHPDTISEWFVQKVMTSGLPRIRLHDYRHTAASLVLAAGVPVK